MKASFRVLLECFNLHHVSKRKIFLQKNKRLLIDKNYNSFIYVCNANRRLSTSCAKMDNIVRSPYSDIAVPKMQLANFLWDDNSKHFGDKVALVSAYTCIMVSIAGGN